jgi:Na+/melibiose symporter-like transporter
MTIETAVFIIAGGGILVAVLIWQTHRLTSRRLGKIEKDLDTLRQELHWLFLKDLNRKSEETAASELVEKIPSRRRDR